MAFPFSIKAGQTVLLNDCPMTVVIGYQPNVIMPDCSEPAIYVTHGPGHAGSYVSIYDVRRARRASRKEAA